MMWNRMGLVVSNLLAFLPRPSLSVVLALLVGGLYVTTLANSDGHADHLNMRRIDWVALELSPDQQTTLEQLDHQWEATYQRLHPQIEQDQARLRELMESPNANPGEMMQVQNRLQRNRQYLHQTATRIFMQKKHRLHPEQRQKLFMMMQTTSASR